MLDKAIKHGKEHRKPHRSAKAVDYTCRNHGSCGYCTGNRLYKTRKRMAIYDRKHAEYENFITQGK